MPDPVNPPGSAPAAPPPPPPPLKPAAPLQTADPPPKPTASVSLGQGTMPVSDQVLSRLNNLVVRIEDEMAELIDEIHASGQRIVGDITVPATTAVTQAKVKTSGFLGIVETGVNSIEATLEDKIAKLKAVANALQSHF
jgi:hypothetical protein